MFTRFQSLLLALAVSAALAVGWGTDRADAASAYYTPVTTPAAVPFPCASDASCALVRYIQVGTVTYGGTTGTGMYAWSETNGVTTPCPGSPDNSTYIRPPGAVSGCFVINGFASLTSASVPVYKPVATIAALEALASPAAVGYATVTGYFSGTFVGGGNFIYQASCSGTVDTGVFVATSAGGATCWARQFNGPVLTSFYGVTSGSSCLVALNAAYAYEYATAAANMQITNDVPCTAIPSSSTPFDASTLPAQQALGISAPYILPGLTYKVTGGSILYAHSTITNTTFVGVPGYKYFDNSIGGGSVYLNEPAVAFKWKVPYGTAALTLNLQQQINFNGAGIGFVFYNDTASQQGPSNVTVTGSIAGDGTGGATAQIGLLCANCVFFNRLHDFVSHFFEVPLWLMDSWNLNNGAVTLQDGAALAILQNNNENSFNSLFLINDPGNQAKYTTFIYRDGAGTNFVSAGAAIGDSVTIADAGKSKFLTCPISSVGRYDESGGTWTINNDMLILSGCTYAASGPNSLSSSIHFNTGTLAGNEYEMDLRPTSGNFNNADWLDTYHQSRFDSGSVYMDGTEQFNSPAGQDSNLLGEAAFVSYDLPSYSGNIFGHVHLEAEGPASGFKSEKKEYTTYSYSGTAPSNGTAGFDVQISGYVQRDSYFGLATAFYGDYANNGRVYGIAGLTTSGFGFGFICGTNCYNVNRGEFSSNSPNSTTWGILDLQLSSGYPATIMAPNVLTQIGSNVDFSSTTSMVVLTASRVLRATSGVDTAYGFAGAVARSFVLLNIHGACTAVPASGLVDFQFYGLADDNSTSWITIHKQMWASQCTTSNTYWDQVMVPVNDNGEFGFSTTTVGVWTGVVALYQIMAGF